MKRLFAICLLASTAQAELIPILAGDDTFILPDVCLYSSTDGVAQVTITSEDAGLEIRLTSDDGTTALVYDAAAEIETIVTNYTWSAPSALNVRLKVQTNGCHQLMFAAASLDNGTIWSSLTIRDTSSPTFMDYDAKLMYVATSTTNQADVNAALVALQLDHMFNQAVVGADVTDNSYAAYLVSKSATADFDSFDNETDAVEAIRDLLVVTDGKVDVAQLDLDDLTSQQGNLAAFLNCEVNTANFAGSTTTFACILTDPDAGAVTQASNDLEGLQIVVTSGDQIREARFINDTTWDGANSELQMTLSRALPATLADAVTAIIR